MFNINAMRGEILPEYKNMENYYATDIVLHMLISTAKYRLYKGEAISEVIASAQSLKDNKMSGFSSVLLAYHKSESEFQPHPFLRIELTRTPKCEDCVSKRTIVIRNPYNRSADYFEPVNKLEIIEKIEDKAGRLLDLQPQNPVLDISEAERLHSIIMSC
jgi:hypothetical protein